MCECVCACAVCACVCMVCVRVHVVYVWENAVKQDDQLVYTGNSNYFAPQIRDSIEIPLIY